jgi:hypothetical protein
MKHILQAIVILIVAALLIQCAEQPMPEPSSTALPSAEPTPSAISEATAVSLPTATPPPVQSLLIDQDFEQTLDGWEGEGELARDETAPRGEQVLRLDQSNMALIAPTEIGKSYKLTVWLRIVEEQGQDWGGFRVSVADWDWQDLAHSAWITRSDFGDGWQKVALDFVATTDQVHMQLGYFGGEGRQMVVVADDLRLFEAGENIPPQIQAQLDPQQIDAEPWVQRYTLQADDPDGAIARVLWDFGDGSRSLQPSGERTVFGAGVYTATVYVTDDAGALSSLSLPWQIQQPGYPHISLAPLDPISNQPSLPISGQASGEDLQIWVSSDRGELVQAQGQGAWQAELTLHAGNNRVLVQTRDAQGRIATTEQVVRFEPAEPLAAVVQQAPRQAERWEPLEFELGITGSAATHRQLPFVEQPAAGLAWWDGVSVDVLFSPDDWQTVYRRPAFVLQPFEREQRNQREWLYPQGRERWVVRFAPPSVGEWQYRVELREAKGSAQSPDYTLQVVESSNANNRGPIAVSPTDARYFRYADGTPFLGAGIGVGFDHERFSFGAEQLFAEMGRGNEQLLRWWIGGQLWGSAWQPWRSRTLAENGYVPAAGLTAQQAYGDGAVSLRVDGENPIMFQGFDSGRSGLIEGRRYRVRVRWRSDAVGPALDAGMPHGVALKLTDWPEVDQLQAIPPLIAHVNGSTPWHVSEGSFVAEQEFLPNLTFVFENSAGGAVFVDEVGLFEELADGSLGPQLLRHPQFNAHRQFDQRRGAGIDAILASAADYDMSLKLVISEKNDWLLGIFAPDGLLDEQGGHFSRGLGSPSFALHEAYWRHLFARFGAFRSVHSWELLNEETPSMGEHFVLANALAQQAEADGNPHPASLSTWGSLAEEAWKDSRSADISYVDFHAYVFGTGWLEPKAELANDSAAMFAAYDAAIALANFGKPVVWGELGIDGGEGTDYQEPRLEQDRDGVWLHKLLWARTGPGGVYPIYWYSQWVEEYRLHPIFGAWNRFMQGIPLDNGRYVDAEALSSNPQIRVLGQKDVEAGQAHLWLDNRQHTWRAVVDASNIAEQSGEIRVQLLAQREYRVLWYDTQTGEQVRQEQTQSDADGFVPLSVVDLAGDVAVRLELVR